LPQKYPEVFTPDPSSSHRKIPHFSVDDFHVQGSRMLSRSFSVPKETVGPDPIGDVSMRSAGDEANDEDAEMGEQPAAENTDTGGPVDVTQPDETLEQEDDAEEDDGESDDDEGSEADAEEEVMVPVADILNAAYDLDNVSSFPKRPDAS
jgi:SET domain-containing protein 6